MKFIYLALIGMVFAGGANAAQPAKSAPAKHEGGGFSRNYGTAGCGLGSMVIGKGDDINQIFAATTNGTFWSQAFGITFGTLNCDGGNVFTKAERLDTFVTGNKVALASDIARGQGEAIVTVASIMECPGSEAALGAELQRNFKQIFPSHGVSAMSVTDGIITAASRNEQLATACSVKL